MNSYTEQQLLLLIKKLNILIDKAIWLLDEQIDQATERRSNG